MVPHYVTLKVNIHHNISDSMEEMARMQLVCTKGSQQRLSQEASKQLASSVVTGDDDPHKFAEDTRHGALHKEKLLMQEIQG